MPAAHWGDFAGNPPIGEDIEGIIVAELGGCGFHTRGPEYIWDVNNKFAGAVLASTDESASIQAFAEVYYEAYAKPIF